MSAASAATQRSRWGRTPAAAAWRPSAARRPSTWGPSASSRSRAAASSTSSRCARSASAASATDARASSSEPCTRWSADRSTCEPGGGQVVQPSGAVAVGRRGLHLLGRHLAQRRRALVDPREQLLTDHLGLAHRPGGLRAPLGEPGLDGGEAVGAEQPLEDDAPLLRPGAQEGGEVALGEQHDGGELLGVHAEQPGQQVAGLVEPRRERLPAPVDQLADPDRRLLGGGARPAGLRPRPGGGPVHLDPATADGELALDGGRDARRRVVAAQRGVPQRGPRAGHDAVEGEADGVEQAGLACAGGTVQEEEAVLGQGVEVDVDAVGERPERLDRHPVQPHASTSSRRTCSSAARSRSRSGGEAGRPRTSARKAQQTSSSSRPATRST